AEPGAKAPVGKSGKKEENPETVKIQAALEAIRTRQPEKDIAVLALGISDGALRDAIAAAESSADLVYRKGKQIEAVLEERDKLVEAQLALARRFTRIVAEITDELSGSADLEPGQAAP